MGARVRSLGLLVAVVSAMTLQGGAASAGPSNTAAVCRFEVHEVASPGFSSAPGGGVSRTDPPGVITCVGVIEGRRLSGVPGTIFYEYHFGTAMPAKAMGGDSCIVFSGLAENTTVTLPMADGSDMRLVGILEAAGTAAGGVGRIAAGNAVGNFGLEFRGEPDHLEEDCVTKPIQHFITTGQGTLTG